mmetsp:Transcript_47119/g.75693  ORF Transcript_47119/g.75693 Transcript_47119/m.75693 type:complete len:268 (+) Transcript_47119:71-874(+)
MGNSCCKLTKRSPNLKVQIDSLRLHMNLDQAMVDSNGTTLSVKGSSPKGAPTKCSAHLRLFRVDQVGYVLQLELVAEDRPKSKYGAVLPVNYVAPRWTCGIQTGFEFFSDPNDIPSRGSKFGESENCYLRYGLGTDQDGLRQGKYKFCIVEADQIHLREYEGKFKFAKGSEGNIKIETHPDAATAIVSGKLHSKFEAPVNLGGPEGRFKVEARSSIKCEIEDGKEPMLQVSTPPRQALEKFLSFVSMDTIVENDEVGDARRSESKNT